MLFSATYSDPVFQFAEKLIADPVIITYALFNFYLLYFCFTGFDDKIKVYRIFVSIIFAVKTEKLNTKR